MSVDPPLMLVYLAQTDDCHSMFAEARRWLVHVTQPDYAAIAMCFATRGSNSTISSRRVQRTRSADGNPVVDFR